MSSDSVSVHSRLMREKSGEVKVKATWTRVSSILGRGSQVLPQRLAVHPYSRHAQRVVLCALLKKMIVLAFHRGPLFHRKHWLIGQGPVHSAFEFLTCSTAVRHDAGRPGWDRSCRAHDCDLFWILHQASHQHHLYSLAWNKRVF